MIDQSRLAPGMQVLTSDGELIGTVDRTTGDGFLLRRMTGSDETETVPAMWIDDIGPQVRLNRSGAEAVSGWKSLKFTTSSGERPAAPVTETGAATAKGGGSRTVVIAVVAILVLAVLLLLLLGS